VRVISSAVLGTARFLYRFIVGDDWTVALVVVFALAATGVLQGEHISAWWLVPLVAIVMTGISLRRSALNRKEALKGSKA
jgi:uncharacterized membrane protein